MPNSQILSSEQLQSKVISFLRFPLCVGVVLIHINMSCQQGVPYPIYSFTKELFSYILAAVAVPLFFMFSGYLFFYKIENFTASVYVKKVRKRIKTLLIPYMFWNSMFILCLLLGRWLDPETQFGVGYSFIDWLKPFWNFNERSGGATTGDLPISVQFWYIRDLMVMVLLSPAIYWLTKRLRYGLVLLLGFLWLTGYWSYHVTGLSIVALLFFSLGAYFSIHGKSFVESLRFHTLLLGVLYALSAILNLTFNDNLTGDAVNIIFLQRINIVLGMAFTVSITAKFISNGKWHTNKFLSESSFFIFAYHMLVLMILPKAIPLNLLFKTDLMYSIMYIFWAITITLLGLILYYYLRKWFPKLTAIITGGR